MLNPLQRSLAAEFPRFFRYLNRDDIEPNRVIITERGIEVEDGWYAILRDLARVGDRADGIRAVQVTQRNGLLFVDTDPIVDDAFIKAKRIATALSAITCEYCGMPGKRRLFKRAMSRKAQLAVRCEEHAQQLAVVA